MSNERIEIQITTNGDPRGAEQVARGLDGIAIAADKAGGKVSGGQGLSGKLAQLFPTFTAAGQAAGALGGRLVALAGGPIGILITAVTAVIGLIAKWRTELKETADQNDAVRDKIAKTNIEIDKQEKAATKAATATSTLSTQWARFKTEQENSADAWRTAAEQAEALADAQNRLERAKIRNDVATGAISPAEAERRNAALDIEAERRRAGSGVATAQRDVEVAMASLAQIGDLLGQARRSEGQANLQASRAEQRRDAFLNRANDMNAIAYALQNGASGEEIVAMLGGDAAAAAQLQGLTGMAGFSARTSLGSGRPASDVLRSGPFQTIERNALAQQLQAQAEQAAAAAGRLGGESGPLGQATAAREAAAAERARLEEQYRAAEERARRAEEALQAARFGASISENYNIPARQLAMDTATYQAPGAALPVTPQDIIGLPASPQRDAILELIKDGLQQREVAPMRELLGVVQRMSQMDSVLMQQIEQLKARIADVDNRN